MEQTSGGLAIRTLSSTESQRALAQRKAPVDPEAVDPRVLEITVRDPAEAAELMALLNIAMPKLREQRERTQALLELVLPSRDSILGRGPAAQALRNANFQTSVAEEFGLLSGAEVAAQSGSTARNAYATANRWRTSGRIFNVMVGGVVAYPGFQFDADGQPVPVVARVLELLTPYLGGWELVGWLTAARGELDGRRAVDVWQSRPEDVVELAQWTSEDLAESYGYGPLPSADTASPAAPVIRAPSFDADEVLGPVSWASVEPDNDGTDEGGVDGDGDPDEAAGAVGNESDTERRTEGRHRPAP